jgi:peptide/nickel transport system permease protein
MDIARYVVRKLAALLPVWLAVSLFAFLLGVAAPGDPAYFVLVADGLAEPTEEEIVEMRMELGLDRPLHVQYLSWLAAAFQGDFGGSFNDGREVGPEILRRLPLTLRLSAAALVVTLIVGVGVGLVMARAPNTVVDRLGQLLALTLISVPNFWLAILLIGVFSEILRWLPTSGTGSLAHWLMPAFVLASGAMGLTMRLSRGSILEEMHKHYVVTAESKGLKAGAVLLGHGFPNALMPVVTVLGTYWANILGGSVIVETIFALPGVGQYAVTGMMNRDYPVVQAYVLLTGTIFVLANLSIDLAYVALNPRVRLLGAPE